MNANKPRVIKDFDKLDPSIQEQIKLSYPYGFSHKLIFFNNKDNVKVSALPFETDEKYYLVRMTTSEAKEIILQDEDYDVEGNLKESAKEEFEDKYADLDYLADYIADDPGEEEEDEDY